MESGGGLQSGNITTHFANPGHPSPKVRPTFGPNHACGPTLFFLAQGPTLNTKTVA